MGFEVADAAVLIHRNLLEVKPRRIGVRDDDRAALVQAFLADYRKIDALAAVYIIYPVACFILLSVLVRDKAVIFCVLHRKVGRFPLCFCGIDKAAVAVCVLENVVYRFRVARIYAFFL
jgi:hypothetical protein